MLMRTGLDVAALRRREFSRLDATASVYLDYAGSALYPESLVRGDARRLQRRVLGNPHSESAPSLASTEALEEARARTLRFFNASPDDYDVVFTANATGAIRIPLRPFRFAMDRGWSSPPTTTTRSTDCASRPSGGEARWATCRSIQTCAGWIRCPG
jgi:selenocysteine lyase/cysteine desulfurase